MYKCVVMHLALERPKDLMIQVVRLAVDDREEEKNR